MNTWTKPIIVDHGGDITKRWYVFYQFRHPETGKLVPFKRYAGVNRIKSLTKRRVHIKQLRQDLEELLQDGFSPYKKYVPSHEAERKQEDTPIGEAIERIIKVKLSYLQVSSSQSFISRTGVFKQYLEKTGKSVLPAKELTRADITAFLTYMQEERKVSNTTRNNYLTEVRALFTKLVEEEYAHKNPATRIKKLPATPTKNRVFTPDQIRQIKTTLIKRDYQLYLFIRWVTYAFLRPMEVTRIKIKHLDLENQILYVKTKTKADKIRRIIPRLMDDLRGMELDKYDPEDYLFSKHGHPGPWVNRTTGEEANDNNRRDFFNRAFREVKKELKLPEEYGIYSFRHSAAGDIYQSLVDSGLSDLEAKYKMLPITGHDTLQALEKYLREAQVKVAGDHSRYINIEF